MISGRWDISTVRVVRAAFESLTPGRRRRWSVDCDLMKPEQTFRHETNDQRDVFTGCYVSAMSEAIYCRRLSSVTQCMSGTWEATTHSAAHAIWERVETRHKGNTIFICIWYCYVVWSSFILTCLLDKLKYSMVTCLKVRQWLGLAGGTLRLQRTEVVLFRSLVFKPSNGLIPIWVIARRLSVSLVRNLTRTISCVQFHNAQFLDRLNTPLSLGIAYCWYPSSAWT